MKKPAHGFTLIELLVVIGILAILSLIGFTLFTGLTKGARDDRKKSDVNEIAKAYELHYDGTYHELTATDFGGGEIPKRPEGGEYDGILTGDAAGFQICAPLGDAPPSEHCTSPSSTCYCKKSSLGSFTTPASTPASTPVSTPASTPVSTSTPTPTPSPTSAPCHPNLVGYWNMDDNVNDSSGQSNHGSWSGTYTAGRFNRGAQFTGSESINVGNRPSLNLTGAFTITAWIKMPTVISSVYPAFIGKMSNDGEHGYRFFYPGSTKKLAFDGYNGPTIYNGLSSAVVTADDNAWHFIAITSNGEFYLDTNNVGTRSYTVTDLSSAANFTIGSGMGLDNMTGVIDEVRVYNTAFSGSVITNDLKLGGPGCNLP